MAKPMGASQERTTDRGVLVSDPVPPAGLAIPDRPVKLLPKPSSTAPEWQKRAWWRQEFREGFRHGGDGDTSRR